MSKNGEIFERVETKYNLSRSQYQTVLHRLQEHMRIDQYGLSTIGNIYFDTEDDALIRQSIEKPVYKEKLRLRCYGVPQSEDAVFLEIKKKYKGIVYKRRIAMKLREAENYLRHGIHPEHVNQQILKEMDYFISYYHPLPKVYIAYDRIALYGLEDADLRITFDFNIRTRQDNLRLSQGDMGQLLMEDGSVMMETKALNAYPLWLTKLFNELEIYPTSFSKYGEFYKQSLLTKQENEEGERICLPA